MTTPDQARQADAPKRHIGMGRRLLLALGAMACVAGLLLGAYHLGVHYEQDQVRPSAVGAGGQHLTATPDDEAERFTPARLRAALERGFISPGDLNAQDDLPLGLDPPANGTRLGSFSRSMAATPTRGEARFAAFTFQDNDAALHAVNAYTDTLNAMGWQRQGANSTRGAGRVFRHPDQPRALVTLTVTLDVPTPMLLIAEHQIDAPTSHPTQVPPAHRP